MSQTPTHFYYQSKQRVTAFQFNGGFDLRFLTDGETAEASSGGLIVNYQRGRSKFAVHVARGEWLVRIDGELHVYNQIDFAEKFEAISCA
jgi:hypothetical protein